MHRVIAYMRRKATPARLDRKSAQLQETAALFPELRARAAWKRPACVDRDKDTTPRRRAKSALPAPLHSSWTGEAGRMAARTRGCHSARLFIFPAGEKRDQV